MYYNMETREMCFKAKRLFKLALGPVLMLTSAVALAYGPEVNQINMAPGPTEVGERIYDLHMIIFWICTVIGLGVFGVMFYSIIYHRKSKGAVPAHFHESTKVEIAWTVVPFLILIGMAVPATSTLLEVYNNDEAELDILVTGYQWKWQYEYVGEVVSFFSTLARSSDEARQVNSGADPLQVENYLLEVDNPLVVPQGRKIRVLITANDVIHAWWVPDFGMKKDAIPGYINEMWFRADFPGTYRGQCAELCGRDHGFMPVVVQVLPPDEFDAWLVEQQAARKASREAPARSAALEQTADQLAALRVARAE